MNLDYQKEYWLNFASKADKDVLSADLNGTWSKEDQEYKSHSTIDSIALDIIKSNTPCDNVLDFGVGMGRNTKYLSENFKNVFGYDTPPMIENLTQHRGSSENISSNIEDFLNKRLDLVFEATVMQHMPPQEVIHRLYSLSYNSQYYFSNTRSYNDYLRDFQRQKRGVNMASLISALDCFEVIYCSIPIEEAKNLMNETHYSILYKSKNYGIY